MIQVHPPENFIQEVALLSINKLHAQGKNISESEANINEFTQPSVSAIREECLFETRKYFTFDYISPLNIDIYSWVDIEVANFLQLIARDIKVDCR